MRRRHRGYNAGPSPGCLGQPQNWRLSLLLLLVLVLLLLVQMLLLVRLGSPTRLAAARIPSRMGIAFRKAPAPSWLTATKRIASRQHLWFLHLPVFLPLAGLQRPPRWDASVTKASARVSQLRWCTPEVYHRCACCKNSLADENSERGSSSAAGVQCRSL